MLNKATAYLLNNYLELAKKLEKANKTSNLPDDYMTNYYHKLLLSTTLEFLELETEEDDDYRWEESLNLLSRTFEYAVLEIYYSSDQTDFTFTENFIERATEYSEPYSFDVTSTLNVIQNLVLAQKYSLIGYLIRFAHYQCRSLGEVYFNSLLQNNDSL